MRGDRGSTQRVQETVCLLLFWCFDSSFPEGGEVTFHCSTLSRFADSGYMCVCLSQHTFSSVMVPLWLTGFGLFLLRFAGFLFLKTFYSFW